jgi:hypothetical protein
VLDICGEPIIREIVAKEKNFIDADTQITQYLEEWTYKVIRGYYTILTFKGNELKKIESFREK